jgi:hypothetical protein
MMNNTFFLTLVSLIATLVFACKFTSKPNAVLQEGYINAPRMVKMERSYSTAPPVAGQFEPQELHALPGNYQTALNLKGAQQLDAQQGLFVSQQPGMTRGLRPRGDFFSNANYQASLSPRFDGTNDYGAMIRYNMPSRRNLAVPTDPLTFGSMACGSKPVKEGFCQSCRGATIEGYCSGCGSVGCRTGSGGLPARPIGAPSSSNLMGHDYGSASFREAQAQGEYAPVTSLPPAGDLTMMTPDGQANQVIVYDRFMFANQRSRLAAQGDWIRGDLPIVPCKNEWFRPAVNPQIDLRQGAMSVLGGVENGTARELLDLQVAAIGGVSDAAVGGGQPMTITNSNFITSGGTVQKAAYASGAGGDLALVAFP